MSGPGSWLNTSALKVIAEVVAVAIGAAVASSILNRRPRTARELLDPAEFSGATRAAFLERVWSQRIVNGLEGSLQHAAEMQLVLSNAPELVKVSYLESSAEHGELLDIEAAYERAGGQLVIVGPPGSGKTTEALKLMRHLLEVARFDYAAPVPELFPLASWAKERKPLLEWLADQLQLRHGWPHREGRDLIWDHHVMPVLDGLDEVAREHRAACLQEVNLFWETYRDGPLVLCSRQAEYDELPDRLKLGGGVRVCQPDAQQIDEYLAAAGPRWDPVRAQLRAGSSLFLQSLLSTPLMLSIAVLAYQDRDPGKLGESNDPESQRDYLWSQYVSTMMTRNYDAGRQELSETPPYTQEQVTMWLGWLAHEMRSRSETELWLHEWSGPPAWRIKIRLGTAAVMGLALGLILALGQSPIIILIFGLTFALLSVLIVALSRGRILKSEPAYRVPFTAPRLAASLFRGASGGLGGGLALGGLRAPYLVKNYFLVMFALVVGLVSALGTGWPFESKLIHSEPSSHFRSVTGRLVIALVLALVVVLVFALLGQPGGEPVSVVVGGLIFGIAVPRFFHTERSHRESPNLGWVAGSLGRLFMAMLLAVVFETAVLLVSTAFGFTRALIAGLVVGLVGGLLIGLASALIGFGPERERVAPGSPTQLIAESAKIGLLLGLVFGVTAGLGGYVAALRFFSRSTIAALVDLTFGGFVAIGLALGFGLDAALLQYAFRLWIRLHRKGPLRWGSFLNWARDHLLLRSPGAFYEWPHLELREYLARQYARADLWHASSR